MAMDFFEHQEIARRKTGRLVILFILAVLCIMAALYVVLGGVWLWYAGGGEAMAELSWRTFLNPPLMIGIGAVTLFIVGGGSGYKIAQLAGGGRTVAEMLNGRLIEPSTTDADERRLRNIVEEMAIASGTPVPPVYVMDDETGINAFAAGYSPDDAVIGVTRGTMALLNRDELQGVIAHEFSHVLNGDMRLNVRLIGILHGILVIGLLGTVLMRAMFYSGGAVGGRRRGKDSGSALPLIATALALVIIGYVGTFFGKLIKAAVSRQREYLADAAAVQFTRNPKGIGGALQKIGGLHTGSRIASPRADEASHLFFGQAVNVWFTGLFATHPPLPERIRRVDPEWDGAFPDVAPVAAEERDTQRERVSQQRLAALGLAAASGEAGTPPTSAHALDDAVTLTGQPTPAHIAYARELIGSIPAPLRAAAHEAYSARALVYALLLDADPAIREMQRRRLEQTADARVVEELRRLEPLMDQAPEAARLPLLEMALPALAQLSPRQYEAFKGNVGAMILADERVDVFEWVLRRLVLSHLEPRFGKARPPIVQYYNLRGVQQQCAALLSTLTRFGHRDAEAMQRAFDAGAARLDLPDVRRCPPEHCGLEALDDALDRLAQVTPRYKKVVLAACAACIAADRQVTVREGELLRAVADALACPMPPILPGEPLA